MKKYFAGGGKKRELNDTSTNVSDPNSNMKVF